MIVPVVRFRPGRTLLLAERPKTSRCRKFCTASGLGHADNPRSVYHVHLRTVLSAYVLRRYKNLRIATFGQRLRPYYPPRGGLLASGLTFPGDSPGVPI